VSRDLVRDLVAERPRSAYNLCIYCGEPCNVGCNRCPEHVDLRDLDPHTALSATGFRNKEGR
jgi:hypothetical protein